MKKLRIRGAVSFLVIALLLISLCTPAYAESGPGDPGVSPENIEAQLDGGDGGDDGTDELPPDDADVLPPDDEDGLPVDDEDGLPTDDEEGLPPDNGDVDDPGDSDTDDDDASTKDDTVIPEPQNTGEIWLQGINARLKGMPRGFSLDAEQLQQKREMATSGELLAFSDMTEGEDYAPDEILYLADTYEEAEIIAEAYGTELTSFGYGVALASIKDENPATVKDLVKVAADVSNNLPPVSANVVRYLFGEIEPLGNGKQGDVSSQWHLTQDQGINVKRAWEAATGDGVTVAVIDSGILGTHNDLSTQYVAPLGDTKVGGGDGIDRYKHGTHVAGIIAAESNSSPDTVGVAPDAKIKSVKVLDDSGGTDGIIYAHEITKGINMAMGADGTLPAPIQIINLSLGGSYPVGAEKEVLVNAMKKGVAIVAAAGNEGGNIKMYPACYTSDIIVVASTDKYQRRSSFSNYGSWIDVSAPGTDILSLGHTGNTATVVMSGTSMAAPVVSGVAALIIDRYAGVNPTGNGFDLNNDKKYNINDVRELEKRIKAATAPTSLPLMGAGVIDASFAVSNTAVSPAISIKVDGDPWTSKNILAGARTEISLNAGFADRIYYTTNGKTPTVASTPYTAPISFPDNTTGKKTLKALSISPNGTYSKVVSTTYTVKIPVTAVSISTAKIGSPIEGKAKTVQLSASISPANASSKTLKWSLVGSPAGMSITSAGKLTIKATAAAGTYTVKAVAADGFDVPAGDGIGVSATQTFDIHPNAVQSIAIKSANIPRWLTPKQSIQLSATLYPADVTNKTVAWSLDNPTDSDYVTLTTAGKLTVKAAKASDIDVTVTHTLSGKSDTYSISTTDSTITKITIPSKISLFVPGGFTPGALPGFSYPTHGDQVGFDIKEYDLNGVNSRVQYSTVVDLGWDSVKFTSSNKKVATVDPVTGEVLAVGKGKATITAKATDKGAKSAKCTVTVTVPVKSLSIAAPGPGGSTDLGAGRSLTPKKTVNSDAGNKGVTWSIISSTAVRNIDYTFSASNGKVTAKSGATGTVTIQAQAKDATKLPSSNQIIITLHSKAATKVSFPEKAKTIYYTSQGSAQTTITTQVASVSGTGAFTGVHYTSSKTDVATVDPVSGVVMALRPGKTVVKATAKDYSGKSAKYTVTVGIPASSLKISAARNHYWTDSTGMGIVTVATGTSLTFKPILGASYGKPTKKEVTWSIAQNPANTFGSNAYSLYDTLTSSGLIKINSTTGKLTASSKIRTNSEWISKGYQTSLLLKATTNDGTGFTAEYLVDIMDPIKFLSWDYNRSFNKASGNFKKDYYNQIFFYTDAGGYFGTNVTKDFTYKSSKPDVAYVPVEVSGILAGYWEEIDLWPSYNLYAVGIPLVTGKKGTATITITANDGSGKKITATITVK